MTVAVALISPWFIEDFPQDAKFLNPKEKEFILYRLKQDVGGDGGFKWAHVKSAFLDWKSYVFALIYIGIAMPLCESRSFLRQFAAFLPDYGTDHASPSDALSLFSPTIIAELGKFNRPQSM